MPDSKNKTFVQTELHVPKQLVAWEAVKQDNGTLPKFHFLEECFVDIQEFQLGRGALLTVLLHADLNRAESAENINNTKKKLLQQNMICC